MISKEGILHKQVCDYLRLQYPTTIFRTDFAAGAKMTFGQAARHKRLQSGRAYPDLFIAEAKKGWHGLFIELKAVNIYTLKGKLKSDKHLLEQDQMLDRLQSKGYKAEFAVGFDHARAIIDNYMGRKPVVDPNPHSLF